MFAILMAEKMSGTSVKIIKNEVGCRDDTVPKTVESTARRIESMQQSSATPSLHLWFLGVAEDCYMLSILLTVPSCFNSFWHGVIPTSYFIFNDFYTCNIYVCFMPLSLIIHAHTHTSLPTEDTVLSIIIAVWVHTWSPQH